MFNSNICPQQQAFLPIHTCLPQIFSGISQQLCSKQSTLLNKLKNKFLNLYDNLSPSNFIFINHLITLLNDHKGNQISFAMQNGIVLLVKKTYQGENVFVNVQGQKEMEFTAKGIYVKQADFHKNKHNYINPNNGHIINQIQQVFQLITTQIAPNKLYGAVIYIYSNVHQNVQHYQQKLLLAVYLALLITNDLLQQMNQTDIIRKLLTQGKQLFNQNFIRKQFRNYNSGELLAIKDNQIYDIEFPKNKKLLVLENNILKQQLDLKSNKIYDQNQNYQIIQKLINGQITMQNILHHIIKKESTQQSIIKQKSIIRNNYKISLVKSFEIHQQIRNLKNLIKTSEVNPQIYQKRFGHNKNIDKQIFSCVPSLSIAILNPQEDIWFK